MISDKTTQDAVDTFLNKYPESEHWDLLRWLFNDQETLPPKADEWCHSVYIIGGNDAGPQRKGRLVAFARQQTWSILSLYLDPVFKLSLKLQHADPTCHHIPLILSAAHHLIEGNVDTSPVCTDFKAWPEAKRLAWYSRIRELIPGWHSTPDYLRHKRVVLLVDPIYREGGLEAYLRVWAHTVETPFDGLSCPERRKWLNQQLKKH